jgi:stress response protein SCP2
MADKPQSKGQMSASRAGRPPFTTRGAQADGQPEFEQGYQIARDGTYIAEGTHGAYRAERPPLTGMVEARLTWDEEKSPRGLFFHLSAFLVDENNGVPAGNLYYCVNHDNNRSKDGSTVRRGYKPHGSGGARDETITINLQILDEEVAKIVIVGYLQTGAVEHTFDDVVDGLVTFTDLETGVAFEVHELDTDYGDGQRAVVIGEFERRLDQARDGDVASWVYLNSGEGRENIKAVGREFKVVFI